MTHRTWLHVVSSKEEGHGMPVSAAARCPSMPKSIQGLEFGGPLLGAMQSMKGLYSSLSFGAVISRLARTRA
jgi:hypothetical protein